MLTGNTPFASISPVKYFASALKTSRLLLRPWKMSDLDDFYEYAKVDGVGQMAGWLPHKNKEESKQVLTKFIENKITFAIVYDNKVIGSIKTNSKQKSDSIS